MLRTLRWKYSGLPSYMLSSSDVQKPQVSTTTSRRQNSSKATLARLPIPQLKDTLQRYIISLQPFLLEDAARHSMSYPDALAQRKRWADDFERGLGQVLQQRLQELDKRSPNNWLDDSIWLKKVYHEWRASLLVNSNWWLSFKNDSNTPLDVQLGTGVNPEIAGSGVTRWQIRRAAWLTHRVLHFKVQVEKQELYPETTKTGIWLRTCVSKIFNIARLPRLGCDTFSPIPSPANPMSRTILCTVRDWFYVIDAVELDGTPVPVKDLEARIIAVVTDVGSRIQAGERAVPVSVLSADHRDTWTKNQAHLLSLSPQNQAMLNAINHSLIGLSLDHYTYALPTSDSQHSTPVPPPNTSVEVDAHLHNLRSSHPDHPGRNRWHDKPFTLIVESNARAGAEGEHSPVDALVPSIVADYAVVEGIDESQFGGIIGSGDVALANPIKISGWRRLDWVVDEHIIMECENAERRLREIVNDSDDSVLWFDAYGADWIQETARLSSDGYIQMALQLAWYRTQGNFTATYETALTRMFKNGRTETIRTLTADSHEWVLAMQNPDIPMRVRHVLLRRAIQTHTGLTRAAIVGRGIDRHLLGLRLMMRPEDGERHELFADELFMHSQTWKLSTSALSAGDQFRGTGFGTPEHDGYGISYLAGRTLIKFGIESKHSCPTTSTRLFKDAITKALIDMWNVCQSTPSAHL